MSIVEVFAFIALFIGCYGTMILIGWAVDTVLRRFFNCGIFPKDYFKP